LGAYDHQDLPFEKLVEELRPARSLSWTPLVQVMFTLQDGDQPRLELPGVTASSVEVDTGTAKFDLSASVTEGPEGLRVVLEYNTDLYEAGTIQRMLGHYETLLAGIVADPGQRLSRLPLLTEAERHQLLVTWNRTDADYPHDRCVHELIEKQAEQTRDAVAVVFEETHLTYRELTHRANQLAHHLRSLGVGPEVVVGICAERSPDMVIGLLGILKAGGAYVPLDPALPPDRLAFMLHDTQAPLLLTQRALTDKIPSTTRHVVCIDADWPIIAQHPADAPPVSSITPDNLAYIMYTSGSTGLPKGVAVAHRQLVNYSTAILESLRREDHGMTGTTFAMVQPFAVDSSLTMIFPSLIAGGCLVLVSRERAIDPGALGEYFIHRPIDILKIAPSHLAALLTGPHPERIMPHRCLIIGGEASYWAWVQELHALAPQCTILNHYGPTETTVGVLTYQVGDPTPHTWLLTPLGRPLPNIQVYVLDQHLQLVPIGVPGELYIGGVGLAREYINRPDLTAETFIPHPFSSTTGARVYRTGDLARYRADGNVEFIGRLDNQVKVHGFRVEPGEIEVALARHPSVREAVALAGEDGTGDKRLVAYIVPRQESAVTTSDLRQFLRHTLPDYMIPAVFVFLDTLPLTPHGKVDRRALPAPNMTGSHLVPDTIKSGVAYIAPRDPMERQLAQLWEELLDVHPVGVTDDFFELGGHSLLAGRLLSRVRARFHADVSLRAFFAAPTVAGLAAAVVQRLAERPEAGAMTRALEKLRGLSDEDARRQLGEAGG
jgi:aspartate racemase